MANQRKNAAKKAARAAEKAARKNPKAFLVIVALLLVIAIAAGACWYFFVYKQSEDGGLGSGDTQQGDGSQGGTGNGEGTLTSGELAIHFLDVGHRNTGDSILIQYGTTEILIDAGSIQSSAATLSTYIDRFCTDGVLEYVIVTHADQDHIAGFVGTSTIPGIFAKYECETIIDFPLSNKDLLTAAGNPTLYAQYLAARDAEVDAGAKHYSALECYKEENGAKRSYELAEGVTLNILYNYYYDHKASDENNYSVCVLLSQGSNHYLFTGDLEEKGEEYLVEYNELPHCKLFKAGHHGSPTSSNDVLLSVIQPEIVCVCCCAGSTQYTSANGNTFPSQEMINRVARYTDKIYVTLLADESVDSRYVQMNGNIVVTSHGAEVTVAGSNNSTILKDTDWFKSNRTWPSYGVQ